MGQSTVQAGVTRWRLSGGSRAGACKGLVRGCMLNARHQPQERLS